MTLGLSLQDVRPGSLRPGPGAPFSPLRAQAERSPVSPPQPPRAREPAVSARRALDPPTGPAPEAGEPGLRAPQVGWGRGGRRSHLPPPPSGRGGPAQGIKAARAGAQASSGVVLAPGSHDQATATSHLTERQRPVLRPKHPRGPPPAPPPCPTSQATGRSSGRKTSRICSKCWVRRFSSAGRAGGAGRCARERKDGRGQGAGAWASASPPKGAERRGVGGSGPGPLAPGALRCQLLRRPACGCGRKHEVGVLGGGAGQLRSRRPCLPPLLGAPVLPLPSPSDTLPPPCPAPPSPSPEPGAPSFSPCARLHPPGDGPRGLPRRPLPSRFHAFHSAPHPPSGRQKPL